VVSSPVKDLRSTTVPRNHGNAGIYAIEMSFCLFVRLFVSLSSVKFVKSFARWQHLAASGSFLYRLR